MKLLSRQPHVILLLLIILSPLTIINFNTWAVLTISGLAMGALYFLMASGMTLTFGLMGVLNLAHGAFASFGAFIGAAVLAFLLGFSAQSTWFWLLALLCSLLAAIAMVGVLGWLFERLIIRPVYADMLKQILVTVGGAIVLVELIQIFFGTQPLSVPRPDFLRGAFVFAGLAIEKYRLLMAVSGLLIYAIMVWAIEHTRLGMLLRASVEDATMVQVLGYKTARLFVLMFVAGAALAGLGGMLWALYQETITSRMGDELLIAIIVVVVMGGLGSIRGCFYAALMIGLFNLYTAYLWPPLSAVAGVLLMLLVLLWRPLGLIPVDD